MRQIKDEHKEVKEKYQGLLRNCYEWAGKLLSEREQTKGNICRYSDTRVLSSKINAVLTRIMLNYLNLLIHHLTKAGYRIIT